MKLHVLVGLISIYCPFGINATLDVNKCIPDLGCFKPGGDFHHPIYRPFVVVPSNREKINTKFRLYTRNNPKKAIYLNNTNQNFDFTLTTFNPVDKTKIIIHGFTEHESDWMKSIRDNVLCTMSANIITVDWSSGASFPYTLAATNARVVGAEVGFLVEKLVNKTGANLALFHLIGFSLGAHAAGYAGERLRGGIERITGLDPAGPLFEGMGTSVRLDPSDAKFVDVIHTDAKNLFHLSFGTDQSMGHVDFYPNGGHDQPGCPQSYSEKLKAITIDVLVKGLDTGSILSSKNKEAEVGFPCKNYEEFQKGNCATCGKNGELCGIMGMEADRYLPITASSDGVKLYLKTGAKASFFQRPYQITLSTADESDSGREIHIFDKTVSFGGVNATLVGENGETETVQLTSRNEVFEEKKNYKFLVTSSKYLGIFKSILLTFDKGNPIESLIRINWRNVRDELILKKVQAVAMGRLKILNKTEEISKYCSTQGTLSAGKVVNFSFGGSC